MKSIKKSLLILGLALSCCAYSSMAQIVISIRPHRPHYERPAPPSSHHIWIDEEWTPHGNTYEFSGGHWVEPPRGDAYWVPGHWKKTHGGEIWIQGQWRDRHHDEGHGHKGHGNEGHRDEMRHDR